MWEKIKEGIKDSSFKKSKKIKYIIFRKDDKSKEIKINPNKDYWTVFLWFIGIAFIPALLRKNFLLGIKIFVAQLFPMYILLNGYLLKSVQIMKIAEFTMLVSMVIITYYSSMYSKRQVKRYRKLGYIEEMVYK